MATKKKAEEEKMRRRRLARFRFRSLVRMVICNNYWLSEIEDQEFGDNARRNIAIIVRRKSRKGLLSILEKIILNQPVQLRSVEQKAKLAEIFRKLKCFSRFPLETREQLSSCARFHYYSAGRTVLREGNEAFAVYFVLNGELTVSRLQWDPVYKQHIDVPCGVRVPGEMFGEIAFLYDCPRTATCITANGILTCNSIVNVADELGRLKSGGRIFQMQSAFFFASYSAMLANVMERSYILGEVGEL